MVIIGILAAVAVPKLFAMVAKSRASELGPAAGTYQKLQDAFATAKDSAGSWEVIGYLGPGEAGSDKESSDTHHFHYQGSVSGTVFLTATPVVGWQANNKSALNNCAVSVPASPNWKLSLQASTTESGAVDFVSDVPSLDCQVLTPLFLTMQ